VEADHGRELQSYRRKGFGFEAFRLEKDVSHALRGMRRTPGFTIAAILILALSVGANTVMFHFKSACGQLKRPG
jgi:hypothetical protein